MAERRIDDTAKFVDYLSAIIVSGTKRNNCVMIAMSKIVHFRETYLGISRQRIGLQFENLAIVPEYKQDNGTWNIYSLISLSRFFKPGIQGKQLAIKIAKLFNQIYGDYILIPKAWPEADVIQLARYSVDNGMKVYALHELDTVLDETYFMEIL